MYRAWTLAEGVAATSECRATGGGARPPGAQAVRTRPNEPWSSSLARRRSGRTRRHVQARAWTLAEGVDSTSECRATGGGARPPGAQAVKMRQNEPSSSSLALRCTGRTRRHVHGPRLPADAGRPPPPDVSGPECGMAQRPGNSPGSRKGSCCGLLVVLPSIPPATRDIRPWKYDWLDGWISASPFEFAERNRWWCGHGAVAGVWLQCEPPQKHVGRPDDQP